MPRLVSIASLLALLVSPCAVAVDTDAPDGERPRTTVFVAAPTYADALASWRSPEDVNAWIGAKFEYDTARASRLSQAQREAHGRLPIHAPSDFIVAPKGVCVDLARFAVETLSKIAPQLRPRYLMIEFDPVTVRGNALRRHWVAAFERDGKLYFFADSKRPGHLAGPYESTAAFVDDYARYRQRTVVAFAERSTYERTQRAAARRT